MVKNRIVGVRKEHMECLDQQLVVMENLEQFLSTHCTQNLMFFLGQKRTCLEICVHPCVGGGLSGQGLYQRLPQGLLPKLHATCTFLKLYLLIFLLNNT
jgi:hypothetical protein